MPGHKLAREHTGRKIRRLERQLHTEQVKHRATKARLSGVRGELRQEIERLDGMIDELQRFAS